MDFGSPWRKHPNCKLILDRETLLCYLDDVTEKLEQRKDLLGKAGCTNTYEYHRRETLPMDCIVFAVEDSVQHGRERPDSARRPRPFPHG